MIKGLKAREILNSRGDSTIEVELETNKGVFKASVPAGASTGKNEAKTVSTSKAIKNAKIIAREIKGMNERKQKKIDRLLIRLNELADLGANTILAVSIAVCRAGANKKPLYKYIRKIGGRKLKARGWKMPKPCFNIINGGAHAGNKLDIQEFMVIPQANTFKNNLKKGAEIYHELEEVISKRYGEQSTNLGDEGGFSPKIASSIKVLDLLKKIIKDQNVKIGLDVAASGFYKDEKYVLEGKTLTFDKLLKYYQDIVKKYPIIFIEDPFEEEDWKSFKKITTKLGKKIAIVGDDLLTTNIERMRLAYCKKACNGVIIKPNQIGTVTQTLQAVQLAKLYKWKIIVSHRSGETLDSFIADLAVGVQSDYIKSGAPARGERLAKYNRLLEIELGL